VRHSHRHSTRRATCSLACCLPAFRPAATVGLQNRSRTRSAPLLHFRVQPSASARPNHLQIFDQRSVAANLNKTAQSLSEPCYADVSWRVTTISVALALNAAVEVDSSVNLLATVCFERFGRRYRAVSISGRICRGLPVPVFGSHRGITPCTGQNRGEADRLPETTLGEAVPI
jgi:hypothetical protein